jgi:hypothetical protein
MGIFAQQAGSLAKFAAMRRASSRVRKFEVKAELEIDGFIRSRLTHFR